MNQSTDPPDKIRIAICFAVVLFVFIWNIGLAHAPDNPVISDFIVIQGSAVRGNTPMFSLHLPVYGALVGGVEHYDLMADCGWDLDVAYAVMWAESRGNPNAINWNPKTKDYSIGLFQINLYGELAKNRPSVEWLLVAENNIMYACEMWQKKSWKPWSVCSNGQVNCY